MAKQPRIEARDKRESPGCGSAGSGSTKITSDPYTWPDRDVARALIRACNTGRPDDVILRYSKVAAERAAAAGMAVVPWAERTAR